MLFLHSCQFISFCCCCWCYCKCMCVSILPFLHINHISLYLCTVCVCPRVQAITQDSFERREEKDTSFFGIKVTFPVFFVLLLLSFYRQQCASFVVVIAVFLIYFFLLLHFHYLFIVFQLLLLTVWALALHWFFREFDCSFFSASSQFGSKYLCACVYVCLLFLSLVRRLSVPIYTMYEIYLAQPIPLLLLLPYCCY